MDEPTIYRILVGIFRDAFDDDSIVLRPETTADDIPGWDSFQHVNLIVAAEMKFGIKFTTSEIEALENVRDMVALIERKTHA